MKDRTSDIIISGHNLELTEAIKSVAREKALKLFEHEGHIIRFRLELEYTPNVSKEREFIAKGHIEIRGKPLISSAETEDLYKSIDQLMVKLDRMLRRRSRLFRIKRRHPHNVEIPAEIPKVKTA
ncbi:MAG: ribosome-associated translation inhibitor RaiA [Opitutales bacterium]|nr:ribosome-associated translation inhibitor RaiA [Opitutales bacterium]